MNSNYHKLLNRQIKKYLKDPDLQQNKELQDFINAVNSSYINNDNYLELNKNAFDVASQEYEEINQKLQIEKQFTQQAFKELLTVLRNSRTLYEKEKLEEGDLLTITSLVQQEIKNRKRTEEQLRKAKSEADKSNQSKSDFLSTMSHEIRSPLNVIIGISHLLSEEKHLETQQKYLSALKINANNLKLIIDDILDFSKIESGKIELEESSFSIAQLLGEIKDGNLLLAQERENQIILSHDNNIPDHLLGDKVRLGQVVTNLVSNAAKFTSKGKIFITSTLVDESHSYSKIKISVKDTGIGIPEEKQKAIFEEFRQASSFTSREYGGTGLGLAITKKLLEMMGATIQLESQSGKGADFFFILEIEKDLTNHINNEQLMDKGSSILSEEPAKILVVEDASFNYLVINDLLKKENIETVHAENGLIAVEEIKRNEQEYDLILMDVQMPVMNGLEATQEIRKFNKTLPIFALTASSTTEQKNKVYHAGMNDFLTKPIDPNEFVKKIKKALVNIKNKKISVN
ncbi:MAG: response regulator [Flavobacteriales bacterium]|jgi:signal transduction histidine kinase/ActR/RegA family two-component response regulator|nr:response regulator [Flavobacteriales bacterium]